MRILRTHPLMLFYSWRCAGGPALQLGGLPLRSPGCRPSSFPKTLHIYIMRNHFMLFYTVGAVLAGLPFSWVARHVAWWGAFAWLQALMLLTLVLKVLTRHVPYKLVPVRKKLE